MRFLSLLTLAALTACSNQSAQSSTTPAPNAPPARLDLARGRSGASARLDATRIRRRSRNVAANAHRAGSHVDSGAGRSRRRRRTKRVGGCSSSDRSPRDSSAAGSGERSAAPTAAPMPSRRIVPPCSNETNGRWNYAIRNCVRAKLMRLTNSIAPMPARVCNCA